MTASPRMSAAIPGGSGDNNPRNRCAHPGAWLQKLMPLFEFSEYDGSQQFRPLSADAIFDKLSEHLIEYGDYVLRQLEHLDEDNADLLKLLIKEGYLEKDETGKFTIAARGVRRIENKALEELFSVQRKDT